MSFALKGYEASADLKMKKRTALLPWKKPKERKPDEVELEAISALKKLKAGESERFAETATPASQTIMNSRSRRGTSTTHGAAA